MGYDQYEASFQNLPCNYHEESDDQEKALLQYYQFQDNFYRGREPPRTTTRTAMEDRDLRSHAIDRHRGLIKEVLSELYKRVLLRVIRKLGFMKILERANKIYSPRTRTRGLKGGSGILKLQRFKIRTINIVVEGEQVKKPQK